MQAPQVKGPDATKIGLELYRKEHLAKMNPVQRKEFYTKETLIELRKSPLPDEKKTLIEAEFLRLCKKNPGWKRHRALRKAAETYHVKVVFDNDRE